MTSSAMSGNDSTTPYPAPPDSRGRSWTNQLAPRHSTRSQPAVLAEPTPRRGSSHDSETVYGIVDRVMSAVIVELEHIWVQERESLPFQAYPKGIVEKEYPGLDGRAETWLQTYDGYDSKRNCWKGISVEMKTEDMLHDPRVGDILKHFGNEKFEKNGQAIKERDESGEGVHILEGTRGRDGRWADVHVPRRPRIGQGFVDVTEGMVSGYVEMSVTVLDRWSTRVVLPKYGDILDKDGSARQLLYAISDIIHGHFKSVLDSKILHHVDSWPGDRRRLEDGKGHAPSTASCNISQWHNPAHTAGTLSTVKLGFLSYRTPEFLTRFTGAEAQVLATLVDDLRAFLKTRLDFTMNALAKMQPFPAYSNDAAKADYGTFDALITCDDGTRAWYRLG
ncbi:hypothetical protein DFH07DRAFT_941914 [Mycena maculata]|uniref:Fungal-type protein kinase domain-containing protein n=1 Tax=Mycena maculata TaxID=230809 RepID=A0AAD7IV93_9AGAR|nr:hypothetical protein DFH07DRAFT_941914 [Mycena maculata]